MSRTQPIAYRLLPPLVLTIPLLVAGCNEASIKEDLVTDRGATVSGRLSEPGHPNSRWIGANIKQLIATHGQPDEIINATLRGGPDSSAYIYSSLQHDGCIDAFVVLYTTGEIIDYICR